MPHETTSHKNIPSPFLSNRIDLKKLANPEQHWGETVAEKVLETFPNEEVYLCAAGVSPSGTVHFGNFRDLMTSLAVAEGLKKKGKRAKLVLYWDDFDRLRKVPAGTDATFEKYIGHPLSSIPDPKGELASYAERFESEFEASVRALGIEVEYRYQSKEYASGKYDDEIIHCLKHRTEIAEVMLENMSDVGKDKKGIDPEKFKDTYFPISVYSRFTGSDNTEVLSYDGESTITYLCRDTKKTDTIDLRKDHFAKLAWKADWAMRWSVAGVHFEPGGRDHATPGGSYDASSALSEKIFHRPPPIFAGYDFIGIRGDKGKMSGSKGNALSVDELLKIYEPGLLKWLYLRVPFHQAFTLAFDTEIIRQYDEYDREREQAAQGKLPPSKVDALNISTDPERQDKSKRPLSFRKLLGYSQIVQWDFKKLLEILRQEKEDADPEWVKERMEKAKNWLEKYNPESAFYIREEKNNLYYETMNEEARSMIARLRTFLINHPEADIPKLEFEIYEIPKQSGEESDQHKIRQKEFFKHAYQLLLGKDQGPRLPTFLWAADRRKVLDLLDF